MGTDFTIGGHEIDEVLYEGPRSRVFRGRSTDGDRVIVKIAATPHPGAREIEGVRAEHAIGSALPAPWSLSYLPLQRHGAGLALVMADIGGVSLDRDPPDGGRTIDEVLRLALSASERIAELHDAGFVHRDIKPANLLVGTDGAVRLCDFNLSAPLAAVEASQPLRRLEGTLHYVSPEQTGRMGRAADHRTDFYSLGATLYELLTGHPPFPSTDPAELVHAHLALRPDDPREQRPDCPPALARILLRLLAKSPDDRYRSAAGLVADLRECGEALERGEAPDFEPGQHDVPQQLAFPERVYGREEELETLLATFEIARVGAAQLVLVEGPPGIGKSALIGAARPRIREARGAYAAGKFDQLLRSVPYSAFTGAVGSLIRQLLTWGTARIEEARDRVLEALGASGRVLTDVVPDLELLIGPQPDVPELGPAQTQARFETLSTAFVGALAAEDRPLVLFLDDLQWADPASIELLIRLLDDPRVRHLLLIGAWRDAEVDAAHPLHLALRGLEAERSIPRIQLGPLGLPQAEALLADTLRASTEEVSPLAQLAVARTGGNPFFLRSFIEAIHDDGLLQLDGGAGRWAWDEPGIAQRGFTENVVDLAAASIRKLSEPAQAVVRLAATVGARFDEAALAAVAESSVEDFSAPLEEAVARGVLVVQHAPSPLGSSPAEASEPQYRFVHDRVQEAAYGLIPSADRPRLHLRIGLELRRAGDFEGQRDRLFEMVGHLSRGAELIEDEADRLNVAVLHERAAVAARASGAHGAARDYLATAWGLLGETPWADHPQRALAVRQAQAEAAYLAGADEELHAVADDALAHASEPIDRVPVHRTLILAQIAKAEMIPALRYAIDVLREFDVHLPAEATQGRLLRELLRTKWRTRGLSRADYVALPEMTDRRQLAVMDLLSSATTPAFLADPEMFPLVSFEMLRLSLQHGVCAWSIQALGAWSIVLSGGLGDVEGAAAANGAAFDLMDRLDAGHLESQVKLVQGIFVDPWLAPQADAVDRLQEAYVAGVYSGDHLYTALNATSYLYYAFYAGQPLADLADRVEELAPGVRRTGMVGNIQDNVRLLAAVECLRGGTEDPLAMVHGGFDEAADEAASRAGKQANSLAHLFKYQGTVALFLGELERAEERFDAGVEWMESVPGTATMAFWWFVRGLTAAWRAGDVEGSERRRRVKLAAKAHKKIRGWARRQPANFGHRAALLGAELARLNGRTDDAMRGYDDAISGAEEQDVPHVLALANEGAARFYLGLDQPRIARGYLEAARAALGRWGADAAVARLERSFGAWLGAGRSSAGWSLGDSSSRDSLAHGDVHAVIDLDAVTRAARALSGEVVLNRLNQSLVSIAVQNAGAQRGVLVLKDGDVARVEAASDPDVTCGCPLTESDRLPAGLVEYVLRSGRSVLLDDASASGEFVSEAYIQRERPRSVLCAPIQGQGQVKGAIYLENNLTAGTFTAERLEVVGILAAQAAISIENAQLVENLEEKVHARTVELEDARQRSDDLLRNILPDTVAEELKARGAAAPVSFESASVLFTDFSGFTRIAERMTPGELLDELDRCFTAFDQITDQNGLEKLKTIGDAYMAVGGIPEPNRSHPIDCLLAALQMQAWIEDLRVARELEGGQGWGLRVGVHTGPLVAGVIGRKKFAYDVWGDTVNTASRMESSGVVGRVNISTTTAGLVGDLFELESRGKVQAKNKGAIEMLFAHRIRPEFSADERGLQPNDRFEERRKELER